MSIICAVCGNKLNAKNEHEFFPCLYCVKDAVSRTEDAIMSRIAEIRESFDDAFSQLHKDHCYNEFSNFDELEEEWGYKEVT